MDPLSWAFCCCPEQRWLSLSMNESVWYFVVSFASCWLWLMVVMQKKDFITAPGEHSADVWNVANFSLACSKKDKSSYDVWQNLLQLHRNHERQLSLEQPRTLTDTWWLHLLSRGLISPVAYITAQRAFNFFKSCSSIIRRHKKGDSGQFYWVCISPPTKKTRTVPVVPLFSVCPTEKLLLFLQQCAFSLSPLILLFEFIKTEPLPFSKISWHIYFQEK